MIIVVFKVVIIIIVFKVVIIVVFKMVIIEIFKEVIIVVFKAVIIVVMMIMTVVKVSSIILHDSDCMLILIRMIQSCVRYDLRIYLPRKCDLSLFLLVFFKSRVS